MKKNSQSILVLLFCFLLIGCIKPSESFDRDALAVGFERDIHIGTLFPHRVFGNLRLRPRRILHVYLDGDGSPWLFDRWISPDPTPHNSKILQLMAMDGRSSIYLGRPCYHGLNSSPLCDSNLWTYGRYSEVVVASMAAVLRRIIDQDSYASIIFVGHSGGGTLAMLLAERFPETKAVVTLAGNLDPEAWAMHHGYEKLTGSLNPASRPSLNPKIRQYHFVGTEDRKVTPSMLISGVQHQKNYELLEIEDFTHSCCWEKVWTAILHKLEENS